MGRVVLILAGVVLLILGLAGEAGQDARPSDGPVGAARVIDGDTLEVAGTRIRLGGIDAPEMAETCTDAQGAPWPCGRWATEATVALFEGVVLHCEDLGERSYNRIVGRCYLDGRDIAHDLIGHGIARVCDRFAAEQGVLERYSAVEAQARAEGAGIFGGPLNPQAGFCVPRVAQAALADAEGNCRIKGNVSANGRIYHVPGSRHYDRVNMNHPDKRWFCSVAEAEAAGWRAPRR